MNLKKNIYLLYLKVKIGKNFTWCAQNQLCFYILLYKLKNNNIMLNLVTTM